MFYVQYQLLAVAALRGEESGHFDCGPRCCRLQPLRRITQADGRVDLAYDMGASFINWLLANYGGIATHARIVALMAGGSDLYAAIETATGQTFFDLENEWRAYIGLPPFDLADIDPAAALEPPVDPIFAEGDTFTLAAAAPPLMFYQEPRPDALVGGQCYANMPVTIRRVGSLEDVDYYQIECLGQVGWITRAQLAEIGLQGKNAH